MERKSMILAITMLFGIAFVSSVALAQVSQVHVATKSATYPIWEPTGAFSALDHYRTVEIEVMVLDANGMGVTGQTVTLSYSPAISGAPTTATEVGNGMYKAEFNITEDSSAATKYSGSVVSTGTYTVTASVGSNSSTYDFKVYYMLCNNCHWDGSNEVNMSNHQKNPSCTVTCHEHHSGINEADWLHGALIPGGSKSATEMDWGTTDAPDACTDCHDNAVTGQHATGVGADNPTGGATCGAGPGGSAEGTCHGNLNLSKPAPYVDAPPTCTRCHSNLSYGTVTSEASSPNTNTWSMGKDHKNFNDSQNVPCTACHQGAHNLSIPKFGDSNIDNQCKECHTTLPATDYRGPNCKGCHYTDANSNGYLDSADYLNVHDRDSNPNYIWDSNDATPGDGNDDPTDATYTGTTITTDASGFKASQSVKVKILDADDTLGSSRGTWTVTPDSTGGWSGQTPYTIGAGDALGTWKIYGSTDGGTTYVLYDRFTVQEAVPEFPLGAGVALGASMLVYMWRRRKYKV